MNTMYRTTDLELVSATSLETLREELNGMGHFNLSSHRRGRYWFESFEVSPDRKTAESNAKAFLRALDELSPASKEKLAHCSSRVLDLAFDIGDDGQTFSARLSAETIEGLARFAIEIRWTLYQNRTDDEKGHRESP